MHRAFAVCVDSTVSFAEFFRELTVRPTVLEGDFLERDGLTVGFMEKRSEGDGRTGRF